MKHASSIFTILTISLTSLLLVNCGDSKPEIKNSTRFNMLSSIDNLLVVGSVDFKKLMEKSDFENNKNLPMEANMGYKMVVRDMIDSDLVGIKLEGNNPIAIGMVEGEKNPLVVFTATVIKADKVKNGVKDIMKGAYTAPDKENPYHYIVETGMVLAWDDADAVLVAQDFGKLDLKNEAKKLLDARYVDAPANEALANFLNRTDDMNMYLNVSLSLEIAQKEDKSINVSEEFKNAFKDAYYLAYGNFNNGTILFDYEYNAPNFVNSKYNFLGKGPVAADFMNFLSADNKLIAFFAASINIGVLMETIKETSPDAQSEISNLEKEMGVASGTFNKLFSGDLAVSFVDLTIPAPITASNKDDFEDFYAPQPEPEVVFSVGINDKNTLETIFATSKLEKKDGYFVFEDGFIVLTPSKLVIVTNENLAKDLAKNGQLSAYSLPNSAKMTSPIFGFLNTDTSKIPNGLLATANDEEGQALLSFLDLFEGVVFEGTIEKAELKINLKNKTDNSLKVITDYILSVSKNSMEM
jgi:hypothetical protein